MTLLGTIFSDGLLHIWCSSEYLGQQDSVGYVGLSQNKLQCGCAFIVMNEHVTQCHNMAHWYVLNSFWTTMELYGTEEEDISGLDTHMEFVVKMKNPEYYQPYSYMYL